MMEQDPESTQFTQTQRGKAEVRMALGGGRGRGGPWSYQVIGSSVPCLSGPGALLLFRYSVETGFSGDCR